MKKYAPKKQLKQTVLVVALLLLYLAASVFKAPSQQQENFENSDATWHVLLTV